MMLFQQMISSKSKELIDTLMTSNIGEIKIQLPDHLAKKISINSSYASDPESISAYRDDASCLLEDDDDLYYDEEYDDEEDSY